MFFFLNNNLKTKINHTSVAIGIIYTQYSDKWQKNPSSYAYNRTYVAFTIVMYRNSNTLQKSLHLSTTLGLSKIKYMISIFFSHLYHFENQCRKQSKNQKLLLF